MWIASAQPRGNAIRRWQTLRAHMDAHETTLVENRLAWLSHSYDFARKSDWDGHCPCGVHADLVYDGDEILCWTCGVTRHTLVHTTDKDEWVEPEEYVPRTFTRKYERSSRFRSLVHAIVSSTSARTCGANLNLISSNLREHGVAPHQCTGTDMRRALRRLKQPDLYDAVPGLVAQLRGSRGLHISTEQLSNARALFDRVLKYFHKCKRVYLPSYRMILQRVLASVGVSDVDIYCASLTHKRTETRVRVLIDNAVTSALRE
jgi:hypothetical protein